MATNCALLAVLKVGGDMIKEGNLTPGALTRFAIQVILLLPFVYRIFFTPNHYDFVYKFFRIQVSIRGSRVFRAINFLFRYVKVLRFCRKVSLLTFYHICIRINVIAFLFLPTRVFKESSS